MCLYPRIIRNRKYTETKKNGGVIPAVSDIRILGVPVKCGQCMECKKQQAREWQVRLLEDIKDYKNGKFITLTFSNESYKKIAELKDIKDYNGYDKDNAIAKKATRLFLERWRKKYKKSLRHWLVTELGHEGTENIHMHGIVWTNEIEDVEKIWNYGFVWIGKTEKGIVNYVSARTVNYITKYIHKRDDDHKYYKTKVLTSAGIGGGYINKWDSKNNKYQKGKTKEVYTTETGHKISLPIYWRNKIYNDEEKEKLWIEKLDKNIRYVNGEKIDISKGEDIYWEALRDAQIKNKRLGYGDDRIDWDRKQYENERRILKQQERISAAAGKEVSIYEAKKGIPISKEYDMTDLEKYLSWINEV